uniref:CWF19-like protein 2 n=1 Tax=Panthera onca TaxID=9690 RepID=UPI002954EE63|nr:CWF19-like protein 2 [Panthera onca]
MLRWCSSAPPFPPGGSPVCLLNYDSRKLRFLCRLPSFTTTATMAATSGRFESERSIEERKEQTRMARAEVLRQAKANFEKEERRKELKRLRGEDTWMLPDVNERIEQFSQFGVEAPPPGGPCGATCEIPERHFRALTARASCFEACAPCERVAIADKIRKEKIGRRSYRLLRGERRQRGRRDENAPPTEAPGASVPENNEDQEVVLVRTDRSGGVWPVSTAGKPLESTGGRRKRQMASTHEEKERVRYFHDDDNLSLSDLVKNEKMGTAENQNKLFMRMASKFMGKTDGDYYTLDDMFVSKAAERERFGAEEENQRKKAIAEHQSLAARMEKCPYCFDSSQFPKHLIVAIGVKVYLCLPNVRSLTEGHCLIVPLQHHRASTLLDEDIWEEIQMFRKSLVKMFEDKGLDCIFLETNMSMKKQYHMVYECIPLPKEVGDMAPIYFKVPRGLPYFSVDFGLQGGFAHVIEDQHKFPHYFGKEIIGGMLDIEPRLWRKGIRESFEDQRKKALQFAQWWKPFDFTKSKKC